jgi:hypothetical protein
MTIADGHPIISGPRPIFANDESVEQLDAWIVRQESCLDCLVIPLDRPWHDRRSSSRRLLQNGRHRRRLLVNNTETRSYTHATKWH